MLRRRRKNLEIDSLSIPFFFLIMVISKAIILIKKIKELKKKILNSKSIFLK